MNPLYNIAISTYRAAAKIVSKRNDKARKMIVGQASTFEYLNHNIDKDAEYIWIHASSLGEFEQGRPLIEMIKKNQPGQKILLTFFSPSGYEVRKDYDQVDAVCYLPFDMPRNVHRFLDIVKPKMAIFIKYEFWGNYLQELRRRNIPTYLISAIFRPTQSFFKFYGGMFRNMLKCYTTIFVQDESSKDLLASIGTTQVEVMGDTRFDRVTDILAGCRPFPIVEAFAKGHFTLIVGSSWLPDEEVYMQFVNEHPDVKLIIAPHELSDEAIESVSRQIKGKVSLYTHSTVENVTDADCLIIDCYGILASCYRYGSVAYVGGGFGVGIHNINEAAVYGIPVVFGPNYHKFKEAHDLISLSGAFSVESKEQFNDLMIKFIEDKDYLFTHGKIAGDYIQENLGATQRIYDNIFK